MTLLNNNLQFSSEVFFSSSAMYPERFDKQISSLSGGVVKLEKKTTKKTASQVQQLVYRLQLLRVNNYSL